MNNFRPISILPTLSKVCERVVHNQLSTYLENNKLIADSQFGFRRNRSTERAATVFLDNVRIEVEKGRVVTALFLDLSKAFDTVSHSKLLTKLSSYGINEIEYEWFCDYLFNRSQHVSVNGVISENMFVESGVPQGSILGPPLFILFINDFTDHVKHSKIVQYADDTVLYISGKNKDELENLLSEDFDPATLWFNENELILNLKKGKTELLTFGTPARLFSNVNITLNNDPIFNTDEYKYLGLTVDKTLNMRAHFKNVFKKASGRSRLLYRLRPNLSQKAAKSIYESVIVPVFTYCSLIFINTTTTEKMKLDSFHKRALKVINWKCNSSVSLPSINTVFKKRACEFVAFCLTTDIEQFKSYFELIRHQRSTRNNGFIIRIPNMKLEYARKSVKYSCCKIFNDLPLQIRKNVFEKAFKPQIKYHFAN